MSAYGAGASRDRQGWFLGMTGPQVFWLLATGFPSWLAMAAGAWMLLLVLVPIWVLVLLLVLIPVRGWSAFQWLGVLVRHLAGTATGWSRFQSRVAAGDTDHLVTGEADLPGLLAGVQIHDGPPVPGNATRPAIIQNHAGRTWAATARITHPGIGLLDDTDRRTMGAGLAELCEAASASAQIHLLALQVRTVPDDGTERAQWVRRHSAPATPASAPSSAPPGASSGTATAEATGDGATRDQPLSERPPDGGPVLPVSRASARLYSELTAMTAGAAVRSETFITVVVREDVIGRDAKRAGRGVTGRARVLHSILAEVEARLTGTIGATQVTWLDSESLAVAIRTGFEPADLPALADAALQHDHDPAIKAGVPVGAAGPTHAAATFRGYRHGEWQSVSTTILLPRKGARIGALARALVPSGMDERRALTVFYRPISQRSADRSTGRAEMSAAMGTEMRRRVGRVERARDRRNTQLLYETDEKLERGRSLVKIAAAMSVTVPAGPEAHDVTRRLDASVRLCGFTPIPLDGAHDAAFAAATIPLGVGLPNLRG